VSRRFAGIDVGARELHCAALDDRRRVVDVATLPAGGPVRKWCEEAAVVAIDAPQAPSTTPHAVDAALPPKFRRARCAEIALGREHGHWVPWVAPAGPPFPPWMETGFAVYRDLDGGRELLEVYPHAGFRELAGGRRLERKQTAAGRRERARLLARAGVRALSAGDPPSHDRLDALMAALIAWEHSRGLARSAGCGHDDSTIWLPDRAA
jgi:predicted nuclease with RNAse H fold